MNLGLKSKVAVVTGGAQGIGAGISRVLAEEGCNIIVNDYCDESILEEFSHKMEKEYDVRVVYVKGDVSDPENADRVLQKCIEEFGGVDFLINNAGIGGKRCEIEELSYDDWKAVQNIDLNGPFLLSKKFIGWWKENSHDGHIVNTISKAAFLANKSGNDAYVCAKAGLMGLTRSLAKGNAKYRIWVNGVIPGYVFNSRLQNKEEGLAGNNRYKTVMEGQGLPFGDFAEPEDIGNAVAFLCSEKARQISGTAIDVTGGTLV